MEVWIQFIVSVVFVVFSGIKIAQYANVIAEKSKLGTLFVGSILLAGGTSLPEVVTGISSGFLGYTDIAVGNVLGSNIFNIVIIAVLDLLDGKRSILRKVSLGHILSANFGMLLSVLVSIAIFVQLPYTIGWIGVDTIFLGAVSFFGFKLLGRYEARDPLEQPVILNGGYIPQSDFSDTPDMSLRHATIGFALSALVIAIAGTFLSITGEQIAVMTGLGSTFIGSSLIAIVTSLPEVVAGLTAVRYGAFDLAIGNLLGSNIFNMTILVMSDIAYLQGPILAAVSPTHILTGLAGMALSTIMAIGLFYRSKRSYLQLGPDSLFIFFGYILSAYLIYIFR
jgi:cation:H+ antiporter